MNWKLLIKTALIIMTTSCTSKVSSQPAQKLPLCPKSPNCVSSQASDRSHYIEPFKLQAAPEQAWQVLIDALKNQARTRIISQTQYSLHAQASSRIFGFIDDIHALLDSEARVIHIRSASRTGYSDFGVNRKRLETLRRQLREANVID